MNLPLPQESVGVEDTQPHDMTAFITRINIRPRNDTVNDENTHHSIDEIIPDNRDELIIPLVPIGNYIILYFFLLYNIYLKVNIPMVEAGSTTSGAPAELSCELENKNLYY